MIGRVSAREIAFTGAMPRQAPRSGPSVFVRACRALSWVLVFVSPVVLYIAVNGQRMETGALLLVSFAVLRAIPVLLGTTREHRLAALRMPLVAVASAAIGLLTHEPRALLVLPSASQLAFAALFLSSLRATPLVEHFARMESPRLGPRQRAYCRVVTAVWGVILAASALAGLALAAWAPLRVWAAFTTVGVYVVIAVVFGTEYVVRRILFRELTKMPVDRLLSVFLPAPVETLDLSSDEVVIPATYTYFRGHFDGLPLLPAVVQITEVIVPKARARFPELRDLVGLRRVRFRRPILPRDVVRVTLAATAPAGEVHFELRVGDQLVSNGVVAFATGGA